MTKVALVFNVELWGFNIPKIETKVKLPKSLIDSVFEHIKSELKSQFGMEDIMFLTTPENILLLLKEKNEELVDYDLISQMIKDNSFIHYTHSRVHDQFFGRIGNGNEESRYFIVMCNYNKEHCYHDFFTSFNYLPGVNVYINIFKTLLLTSFSEPDYVKLSIY